MDLGRPYIGNFKKKDLTVNLIFFTFSNDQADLFFSRLNEQPTPSIYIPVAAKISRSLNCARHEQKTTQKLVKSRIFSV
jgi:hypothetical protein